MSLEKSAHQSPSVPNLVVMCSHLLVLYTTTLSNYPAQSPTAKTHTPPPKPPPLKQSQSLPSNDSTFVLALYPLTTFKFSLCSLPLLLSLARSIFAILPFSSSPAISASAIKVSILSSITLRSGRAPFFGS